MQFLLIDTIPWDYDVSTPLDRPLGGTQSAACYLAQEWARSGHDVTMVTATTRPGDVLGVHCVSLNDGPVDLLRRPYDACVLLSSPGLAPQLRPDLPPQVPLIYWGQHAADQPAIADLADRGFHRWLDGYALVSQWQRQTYAKKFGIAPERMLVLENAVAPTFENLFSSPAELVAAKSRVLKLAYTSTPFRGLELLIDVFPQVRQAFPEAELHVFSSMKVYQCDEEHDDQRPLYERCRRTPGVVFHGSLPQSELPAAMRDVSILSYPNTFAETSCIAVMEAMAAGAYVVSSHLGALPETTMGLGTLVPVVPSGGAQVYAAAFQATLLDVLRQRAADPAAFAAARFAQVQQVNQRQTWTNRARQWEQAVRLWGQWRRRDLAAAAPAPTAARMTVSAALDLAQQHMAAGRAAAAEAVARAVLKSAPDNARAHGLLGSLAFQQGAAGPAVDHFRRAAQLEPGRPEHFSSLALALWQLGRLDEAEEACRRALALDPEFVAALNNLAHVYLSRGRDQEAAALYRRVLARPGHFPDACNNLGTLLHKAGHYHAAIEAYRQALAQHDHYLPAMVNLATALEFVGRFAEALALFEKVLTLAPQQPPRFFNNYGATLNSMGRHAAAEAAYRRAIELDPQYAKAYANLSQTLNAQGRIGEAETAVREALELDPATPGTLSALGNLLLAQGRAAEGFQQHQAALAAYPDDPAVRADALLCQQYVPGATAAELLASHRQWGDRHGRPLESPRPPIDDLRPDRPLRLGFVSQDLGYHPVGRLLLGMVEHLDRDQFSLFYYSDRPARDPLTERIAATAHTWRNVRGRNNADLAEQIRADCIDVLFDLDGYTSKRMPVFARKPAPLQVAWLGYPGTTGLAAIDYLVADAWEVPAECESLYRESLLRMPHGYLCYTPPDDAPPVGPLPMQAAGCVTFGSFNNLSKINGPVIELWSAILRRVPGSRLLLKFQGLQSPDLVARYRASFAAQGIEHQRLLLEGPAPHAELLARYAAVDVALDPFPYSGGLTTCEALWMGVPVITLPGDTFAGRHSLSHLSNVGLTETIAANREEYIALAVRLTGDPRHLAELRQTLRPTMAASPLCDGPRFAADFATQLRAAWQRFVKLGTPA